MPAWGIVYAAGYGRRFGGYKQFELLHGKRLVDHCVDAVLPHCDGVTVVLPPGVEWDGPPATHGVAGGETNPESVRNGLEAVPAGVDIVVLHSPSHPLASSELVAAVLAEVRAGVEGSYPVMPIHDVIKEVDPAGWVTGTVPKAGLAITQMPMAFRLDVLRDALARAVDGSDAATLAERFGARVRTVAGEIHNLHVTTREELDSLRRFH